MTDSPGRDSPTPGPVAGDDDELDRYTRQWRAYRAANRDKVRAWQRGYYQRHRERIIKYNREWAKRNPEKVRGYKKKHRDHRRVGK